jgi:phenylacetate-CoA ligase
MPLPEAASLGGGFPRILPPAAAVVLDVHRQLEMFERLAPDAQRRICARQLGLLVGHARRHSTFWRDRLPLRDGTPQAEQPGTGIFRLRDLPVLARGELQDAFEAMRAHAPGWQADAIHPVSTSGSTGRPVRVERFLPRYGPIHAAILLTDNRWHGRDANLPIAAIVDAPDGKLPAWDDIARMFGYEGPTHVRNLVEHDPGSLLSWLQEVRPTYLATTPAMLGRLAELSLGGGGKVELSQVITFGETVKPELRGLVREAFGARVTDRYSCEEVGAIALQCPRHDHYHVMLASVLVEIVDERGRACGPGVPGRVLLTGLHSFALPLIRYEVGDYAEWGGPCDCGITLPVIGKIWGRERSFIRLGDGTLRLARLTGEYWRAIAPVREYRVVQYGDGLVEAFVTCGRALTEAERGAMVEMLRRVLDAELRILVTQTHAIDWGSRWKREDVLRVDRLREGTSA